MLKKKKTMLNKKKKPKPDYRSGQYRLEPFDCARCAKTIGQFDDYGIHECTSKPVICKLCGSEIRLDVDMAFDSLPRQTHESCLKSAKMRGAVWHKNTAFCSPTKS